jgi:electron transport complex protein RnfD
MDKMLHISVNPHTHCGRSTSTIMRDVLIALAPATIAGVVIFGLSALLVVAVCVASCVLFEYLFNLIVKKEQTIGDLSAVVTGLLLGLNLPANIPVWQAVIGSLFAIIVVKCLFGGIGFNIVNPAITARVFMLVSFGSMATAAFPKSVDVVSGATPLAQLLAGETVDLKTLLLGTHGGSIGETCAIALLIGGIYLLAREVITWHIPVSFIGSVFVLSLLVEKNPTDALAMVLSGGLILGAIFMATDYVTSPSTPAGKIIFGLGCGLLTFLIRYFGSYPEGVSFAILIMNIVNPYIDKLTAHKVYGGKKV